MSNEPKFCVHCGAPLTPGVKFCIYCGNQLVRDLNNSVPGDINSAVIEKEETPLQETSKEQIQAQEKPQTSPQEKPPFKEKFIEFFKHPNPLIFSIAAFILSILLIILINANGFAWWILFFFLPTLGCFFEIVLSILQTPTKDGSKKFFKRFPNWIGIGKIKKVMVKGIITSIIAGTALSIFFGIFGGSVFVGFANFVVVNNHTYEMKSEDATFASQYGALEGGYERLTFLPGNKFEFETNYQSTVHGYINYGADHVKVTGKYTRTSTALTLRVDQDIADTQSLCGIINYYGTTYDFKYGPGSGFIVTIKNGKTITTPGGAFNKVS